jgi:hypothetical protein
LASAAVARWAAVTASSPPPTDPFGPVGQNPDDVRDAACRIVETSKVCNPPAPPASIPDRTPSSGSGGGGVGSLLGLLLWVLLIGVVVALVFVAVRYFGHRRPSTDDLADDRDNPDDDALAGTVIIDRSREPRGWREEAERHRADGRFRDSIRCRYRALVGDLARRGLLDEIPGRTTGEERAQFAAKDSPAQPAFDEAIELFDGVWYGDAPATEQEHERFVIREREVLAATAGRGRR